MALSPHPLEFRFADTRRLTIASCRFRRSVAIGLSIPTLLGANETAFCVSAEASDRPYRVVDLDHPPTVSQMVPLGMTEFGATVALGWRNESSPAAEMWVNLPSPMFGLADGWNPLGPLPDRGPDRVTGVVFSPSLRINAHAGATGAIDGEDAAVETLVVGSEKRLDPKNASIPRGSSRKSCQAGTGLR